MLHRHDFHPDIYTFSFLCEERFRNIVGYLERMKAEFYPDWDELLAASKNEKGAGDSLPEHRAEGSPDQCTLKRAKREDTGNRREVNRK